MKNSIKLFALAALLGLGGCHEPDELTPSVVDQGLNTISAQFATGEYKNDPLAKFTAAVTEGQEYRDRCSLLLSRKFVEYHFDYPDARHG